MGDGKLSNLEALRRVWSSDHGLTTGERGVFTVLILHRNQKTGKCCPNQWTIAGETGLTRNGVQKILRKFESAGLIRREGLPGKPTNFTLSLEGLEAYSVCPQRHTQLAGIVSMPPVLSMPEHIRSNRRTDKQRKGSNEPFSKAACEIWGERMGGTAPRVRINKALSPLVEKHGAKEVLKWWDKYLANPKTGAQFKNPQDFASRFGAWRQEHSKNGSHDSVVSVEDIRRGLRIGGQQLAWEAGRDIGFATIADTDHALWNRIKLVFVLLDLPYLVDLAARKNGYELDRAIKSQLELHATR